MNRREKRFFKKEQEKKLLALNREKNELWKKAREPIEYIELEKPIRDGWIRYFDLREDLKGRPDYKYLKEILDVCNCEQFCRSKRFIISKRHWRYDYFSKEFHMKNLSYNEYNKLSERAKAEFWKEEKVSWSGSVYGIWHPAIPNWMLMPRVKPHFIRYFKVFDNEAKSKYDRIENEFNRRNLYPKLDHILGIKQNWRDDWGLNLDKNNLVNKIAKKEMKEEAENYF